MRYMRWLIYSFLYSAPSLAAGTMHCGLADGYPPFQFKANGPAGIDYEILQRVAKEIDMSLQVQQTKWDDVVALLRLGKIDCAAGMEVNEARQKMFDFTQVIYARRNAVFILEENKKLTSIDDLVQHRIAGDRQSFVERYFEKANLLNKMRVVHPATKAESMELLKRKEVDAVIAPLEVGLYLARELGLKVKVLVDPDPGSPVAIAVRKGDKKLLETLNRGLESVLKRDVTAFRKIIEKWRQSNH